MKYFDEMPWMSRLKLEFIGFIVALMLAVPLAIYITHWIFDIFYTDGYIVKISHDPDERWAFFKEPPLGCYGDTGDDGVPPFNPIRCPKVGEDLFFQEFSIQIPNSYVNVQVVLQAYSFKMSERYFWVVYDKPALGCLSKSKTQLLRCPEFSTAPTLADLQFMFIKNSQ